MQRFAQQRFGVRRLVLGLATVASVGAAFAGFGATAAEAADAKTGPKVSLKTSAKVSRVATAPVAARHATRRPARSGWS